MELFIEITLGIMIADLIIRGVLFSKREEKWYKTLVPGYNRYTIGKLSDSKLVGLIAGISNALFILIFLIYLSLEAYLLENGMLVVQNDQIVGIAASDTMAFFMNYILPYAWYAMALIAWLSWVILMRKFSIKQGASSWWMFAWAICPIAGYIYFACVRNRMYIPEKGIVDRNIEYKKVKS